MKIRRFLSGLLCAGLLLALAPAAAAASPVEISSAEELSLLRETPGGEFVLTADIDMTGIDWQSAAFSGTLDGGGHTIYNIAVSSLSADRAETVDGNDKRYDTALTGFFSALNGASIRDLTLRGVDISVTTPENAYAGVLAGFASPETALENVCIYDARLSLTETCQREPEDEHDRCIAGIGGLIGFGGGTYTNCTAETTLVFSDESIDALRCEQFLGGILACGNAALTGCSAVIDGYAACRGYAHNGGLVGMFYQYDTAVPVGTISGCTVTGKITFFENNADRRAYCEAFAGELLTWTSITDCTADFLRDELFDYAAAVKPEKCEAPSYTDTVAAPGCDSWGYTEHTCAGCGYVWRDTITPPQHTPGEWVQTADPTETEDGEETLYCALCGAEMEKRAVPKHVSGEWMTVTAPTYDREGLRQRFCADCGVLLGEESIPMLIAASGIEGLPDALTLHYKDTVTLEAVITPEDASDKTVRWYSSDINIVSVDPDSGEVRACARGETVLTCVSGDGFVTKEIPVTVDYTVGQWLIKILLFGWAWY